MKRFVYSFLCGVISILSLIAGYNYITDTSGIYNTDFSVRRNEPDQHFVKIRYLLGYPNRYNAYCFGSSRVGNIDLQQIHDGNRYYNMTYSEGLPQEWLQDIKMMLEHDVTISEIMLGIDDFSFRIAPKTHETQSLRVPYHENNLRTYVSFLLHAPSRPDVVDEKGSIYDIYNSGRPLHSQADEFIEAHVDEHVNDSKFDLDENLLRKSKKRDSAYMAETIAAIQEIKEIADIKGIKLIVFVNPMNQKAYLQSNIDDFNEFKRQLADVTDYYDFSGLNEITMNNYNYYEASHYRPLVGDKMIEVMFREKNHRNEGFGAYVTKENVEQHIGVLKNDVDKYWEEKSRGQE